MTKAELTEADLPAIVRKAGLFALKFPPLYFAVTGAATLGSAMVALQNGGWPISAGFLLLFVLPYLPILLLLPFVLFDLLSILVYHTCMALILCCEISIRFLFRLATGKLKG